MVVRGAEGDKGLRTMRLLQEEVFGPVLAVTTFDTPEEAIRLANDTDYGLAAYVYTTDLPKAQRCAMRIKAGQVGINQNVLSGTRDIRCPFVGHKKSGYGSHSGKDGWRQFSVRVPQRSACMAQCSTQHTLGTALERARCTAPPGAQELAVHRGAARSGAPHGASSG